MLYCSQESLLCKLLALKPKNRTSVAEVWTEQVRALQRRSVLDRLVCKMRLLMFVLFVCVHCTQSFAAKFEAEATGPDDCRADDTRADDCCAYDCDRLGRRKAALQRAEQGVAVRVEHAQASKQLQAVHAEAAEMAPLNVAQDAATAAEAAERTRTRKLLESKLLELAKQRENAEFLAEKAEVDKKLGRKLAAEERKRTDTKQFLERYLVEREEYKLQAPAQEKAESAQIDAWQQVQRERLEQAAAAKAPKAESERRKYESVKSEIEEKLEPVMSYFGSFEFHITVVNV